uniref:Uncharacterized protein n=1 Tax=Knipowitschia caucasica TaxID=637954 RepID=A0AAV2JJV5_KNICA
MGGLFGCWLCEGFVLGFLIFLFGGFCLVWCVLCLGFLGCLGFVFVVGLVCGGLVFGFVLWLLGGFGGVGLFGGGCGGFGLLGGCGCWVWRGGCVGVVGGVCFCCFVWLYVGGVGFCVLFGGVGFLCWVCWGGLGWCCGLVGFWVFVLWLWGGVEWKWVGCWGLFVLWGGGVGGFEDMMVGRECIGLCGGKFGWRGVVWGVGGMKIGDMGVVGVVWVGLGVGDGVFGWCWCWVVVLGFCLGLNLGDLVIVGFGKGFLGVFVFIVVVGGLVFVVVVLCWVVGCVCCGLGDGVGVFVVVRSGLVLCFFLLVGD